MIEQGLFKRHFVGRDGFIWWIGQIADDSWTKNLTASTASDKSVDDSPGFGYRYQVRIMGYHTADDTELRDEDLPWAAVMYPVTSGGGGDIPLNKEKCFFLKIMNISENILSILP